MWLYGVAFSLSFWFSTLNFSLFIELVPLFIASFISLLYAIKKIREENNPSLEVAALSTSILLIVLFWIQPDDFYYIFSIVFAVITILCVVANAKILFIAPPTWMGLGNAISLILSVVIYVMFYASIKKHIENFYILIPLGILLLIETYIVLNIQKMPSLNESMKSRLRTERITYLIALIIVFITSLLYISDVMDLQINLFICVVSYSIGLLYSTSAYIWNTCRNQSTNTPTIYQVVVNEGV